MTFSWSWKSLGYEKSPFSFSRISSLCGNPDLFGVKGTGQELDQSVTTTENVNHDLN